MITGDDKTMGNEKTTKDEKKSAGSCPPAMSGYISIDKLRKAAKCVFLATDEATAQDLSDKLNSAANMIEALQDFAIWMTGCGYDFCQHKYFCKQRDKLLKT